MPRMTTDDLHDLLARAFSGAGFSRANADALARQTVLAEALGQAGVGVAHAFDFIDGIAAGRIDGMAVPVLSTPAPAMIHVDGQGGLPQTGFDAAFPDMVATANKLGLCAVLQSNATLCGSLGTFALRVAEAGLVCFAATNGSALLAGSGTGQPVFCTNPMAFAAPREDGPPLLIDQSSSATAFVNIRAAAENGETIPGDWAVDKAGKPTTDARAALDGALLPFAGARGSNIALMVEVLAAGLTGANWSLDAPAFFDGGACPRTGLFVLAIDPAPVDQGFAARLGKQLRRLGADHGLYIPGLSKGKRREHVAAKGLDMDPDHIARLETIAAGRV